MKTKFKWIGIAFITAMLALGLLACPDEPVKVTQKSNKADLDSVTLGVDQYNVQIGDPIAAENWDDLDNLTDLDIEQTGKITITSTQASVIAEITLIVSEKAKTYFTGAIANANNKPDDDAFDKESGDTITLGNNQYVYVQVTAEDGKTVNYYRFKVEITVLGSSVQLSSIMIGTLPIAQGDRGTPGTTTWPTSTAYGTVNIPVEGLTGVSIAATPSVTGPRAPKVEYGKSTALGDVPALALSLTTDVNNGDLIYIKVTSESGLVANYYIIQAKLSSNANLTAVTVDGTASYISATASATLPVPAGSIGAVSLAYKFSAKPAASTFRFVNCNDLAPHGTPLLDFLPI